MGSKLTLAESIESEKANQEAKIYLRITKKAVHLSTHQSRSAQPENPNCRYHQQKYSFYREHF